jgi:hypothetical protein
MTASFTFRFCKQYQNLSAEHQAKFDKQLGLLFVNLRRLSFRAKEAQFSWAAVACGLKSSFSVPNLDSYSATTRLSTVANRFTA